MLRDRKILVHPAIGRAIHDAEVEMQKVIDNMWANFLAEIADLKSELAEARRELDFLRALAAEARCDPRETVH